MVIHTLAPLNAQSRRLDNRLRQAMMSKLGGSTNYPPFAHRLSDQFPTPLYNPVHTLIDSFIHKRVNRK